MTNYSNYHAYRGSYNWKKFAYRYVADALLDPTIENSLTKKGYVYICSDKGYGDGAIIMAKHKMLKGGFKGWVLKYAAKYYKFRNRHNYTYGFFLKHFA